MTGAADAFPSRGRATALRRHDRVWLAAATGVDARLVPWIAAGRALVVRRRDDALTPNVVPLAVALPLAGDRARIALVVERAAIVRTAPPLALLDVVATAPPGQRAALTNLVARGAALGTAFSVYGSFAWQAISGEPCVTPESDLDLLWDVGCAEQARRTIAMLLAWEREAGLRADGEARFPDGDAVAWRELASSATRVLVKRDDGVALRRAPL